VVVKFHLARSLGQKVTLKWSSNFDIRYHCAMPSTSKKITSTVTPSKKTETNRLASNARVLRQFRVVINSVKTHFRQVEKMAGVGGAQLWALSVIQSTPGLGMNELSEAMDIHQSTASNLVKALVAQEMVAATKTGADRRAVELHILPGGVKVLKKAPEPFAGVLPDALASLDAPTLARLEKDLATLILALNADARAANTPLADLS
jgi:DNA-binding MarR family transcriptional regulator